MNRYSYLQAMPNSPLSPLTPLSENTQFQFNFGGDGSLDEYIESVLQEHRVEQQREKLLQQANQSFQKKLRTPLPRRYSEEFLKIRDIFEGNNQQSKEPNCNESSEAIPQTGVVNIIRTEASPISGKGKTNAGLDYANTPTNIRTPLKLKNNNAAKNLKSKIFNKQQQQKLQQKQRTEMDNRKHIQRKQSRAFIQASPVTAKPLCSQVKNILQQCGLTMYYGIFQKEEIDLMAFRLLRLQDLHGLGITNQRHCTILMKSIHYMRQYMCINEF